jgi:NADP-reducing hydrogenase subunit HndD
MIREMGIDFRALEDMEFDNPLGMSTGAADIFGLTGGVMEAALRTVYELVTGRELPFEGLHVTPIVGLERVKEAALTIENPKEEYKHLDGVTVKVAVTSGLKGAKELMRQVAEGRSPYHFIEVMGCPGGCIMGGGQPRSADPDVRQKRLRGTYDEDESKTLRKSHENPYVASLYKEYLEHPGSHVSHKYLHTHYVPRGILNELTDQRFSVAPPPARKKPAGTTAAEKRKEAAPSRSYGFDGIQSAQALSLEAENTRLKSELADTSETVEILKNVIADYLKRER